MANWLKSLENVLEGMDSAANAALKKEKEKEKEREREKEREQEKEKEKQEEIQFIQPPSLYSSSSSPTITPSSTFKDFSTESSSSSIYKTPNTIPKKDDDFFDFLNGTPSNVNFLETPHITSSPTFSHVDTFSSSREVNSKESIITKDNSSVYSSNSLNSDQLETSLRNEEKSHQLTRQQSQEKQRILEFKISQLNDALASTQKSLDEKSNQLTKFNTEVRTLNDKLRVSTQESTEYKSRASKVLQEKEKTIRELSLQLSSPTQPHEVNLAEVIQLRQEKDSIKSELEEVKQTNEILRATLQDTQSRIDVDMEALNSQIRSLEDNIELEKKRVQNLQVELLSKNQEVEQIRNELQRNRESYQASIKSYEDSITKLKRQNSLKSSNHSTQEELEGRLKTVTERLIEKHNQLEIVNSEKSYLQMQLETLRNEKRDHEHAILIGDRNGGMNKKNESGPRLRSIASLVEDPSSESTGIRRRMIGAANLLDSVSTITGKFLTHSPIARLIAIGYLIFLHLWVLYVFVTFKPEVHSEDFNSPNH